MRAWLRIHEEIKKKRDCLWGWGVGDGVGEIGERQVVRIQMPQAVRGRSSKVCLPLRQMSLRSPHTPRPHTHHHEPPTRLG